MNGGVLFLGYIGGAISFVLGLPNILRYYRPRKIDGRWRIEGVRPVVFTPAAGMSGAASTDLLRAYRLRIHSPILIGHEQSKETGVRFRFLVLAPGRRVDWARYLLWRAGCEVQGYKAGERPAGMPAPWQASTWEDAVRTHTAPGQPAASEKRAARSRTPGLRERLGEWL